FFLALKAQALHLADRTSVALQATEAAETVVERSGARVWCAELHRLRGMFLAAIGADETQIDASFCAAIRTAKEQKSTSLAKRAEAAYAEYRRKKERLNHRLAPGHQPWSSLNETLQPPCLAAFAPGVRG